MGNDIKITKPVCTSVATVHKGRYTQAYLPSESAAHVSFPRLCKVSNLLMFQLSLQLTLYHEVIYKLQLVCEILREISPLCKDRISKTDNHKQNCLLEGEQDKTSQAQNKASGKKTPIFLQSLCLMSRFSWQNMSLIRLKVSIFY